MTINKKTAIQIMLLSLMFFIGNSGLIKAETVEIFGKVMESNGQGIDQAKIIFISQTTDDIYSTVTDSDGTYSIRLKITETLVSFNNSPRKFQLFQNFPNPFNPSTKVAFSLLKPGFVKLCIYNTRAQLVNIIAEGCYTEGIHQMTWDGRDMTGKGVAAGVYFYRLESGDFSQTRKMAFIDGAGRNAGNNSVRPLYKNRTCNSNSAALFKLLVKKPGFDAFLDDSFKVPLDLSQINKDIVLQRLQYLPLNVGNSWTFSYKLSNNVENEVTFKIIDKNVIDGYDYFVFDMWPLFLPSNFTHPVLPAAMRINAKFDAILRVENTDAFGYKFSDTTLDSMRLEHIDYNDIYGSFPKGVDLVTLLLSVNDSVHTDAGQFRQCYKFYASIGQVADAGRNVWFAPKVGPVRIQTFNIETDYRLIRAEINGKVYSKF